MPRESHPEVMPAMLEVLRRGKEMEAEKLTKKQK